MTEDLIKQIALDAYLFLNGLLTDFRGSYDQMRNMLNEEEGKKLEGLKNHLQEKFLK